MFVRLQSLLKIKKSEERCSLCGEVILGGGVERYGKRFCQPWHADFSRPPSPWSRRLRWPEEAVLCGDMSGAMKGMGRRM